MIRTLSDMQEAVYIYIYIYIYRERERERVRERERERERDCESYSCGNSSRYWFLGESYDPDYGSRCLACVQTVHCDDHSLHVIAPQTCAVTQPQYNL